MSIQSAYGRLLRSLRQGGRGRRAQALFEKGEPPLRAELFGLTQLEKHAESIASGHTLDLAPGRERLLRRLAENERVIRESYGTAAEAAQTSRQLAPAAEWLLDNYYLIREQIALASEHLTATYSRELPRLGLGPLKGFPRVYDISLELVLHADGRVDRENVYHFVQAYQRVSPLKLGELWAVPIMMRLALIENLRRVSHRIAWRRRQRDSGEEWGTRLVAAARAGSGEFITELAAFVRAQPALSAPFVTEMAAVLEGSPTALAINWIEQQLTEQGQSVQMIQQVESQDQASDQISIGNSITSLRTLNAVDWSEFVEGLSETEAVLRRDPLGVYAGMDFATRDSYRHAVEGLAKGKGLREPEVAKCVVSLAAHRRQQPHASRRESHVGYFLVGPGEAELERELGYRRKLAVRVRRFLWRRALYLYLTAILILMALFTALLALEWWPSMSHRWELAALLIVITMAVVSRPAVSLVNWLSTRLVSPYRLPRMDFSKGIPAEHCTAVVVPALLYSAEAVETLLRDLEIRYLANRSPNLFFGLLTDPPDSKDETHPEDARLVAAAVEGIRALNARYASAGGATFFLAHRPRRWNPAEGVWMGRERKRGKLEDFNGLLIEGAMDSFSVIEADIAALRAARYVITLDSDTGLPPGAAWKLAAALAHPLNRPQVNPQTRCVEHGYGVIQPRVANSLVSAGRSLFALLYAGDVGIDPYTREVSNAYHDLFRQSSYSGKGIYDLHAFHATTGRRFPENRILSHDLLEGCYARCGFLNDVDLIEEHPSGYLTDMKRRHRWARGDWQITRWLCRRVPGPDGALIANPLGLAAKWMVFDNLRRTLVPILMVILFAAGWLFLARPAVWTLTLVLLFFLPSLIRLGIRLFSKGANDAWTRYLVRLSVTEAKLWSCECLCLALLPFESIVYMDAMGRVLWRLLFSHRLLLEWQTAFASELDADSGWLSTVKEMWVAPCIAFGCGAMLLARGGFPVTSAAPILAMWTISPALAGLISRPFKERAEPLCESERLFLRRLARRTWMYFEHFALADQNWLPADNFQETPSERVAGRTSPTNIGMAVLSSLAAYDLGYLSAGALVERTRTTFDTLDKLERYRGHFYNWYGTQSLQPLSPAYLSTVDSGNLSGLLLTFEAGLRELVKEPVIHPRWREGLEDIADVLLEEIRRAEAASGRSPEAAKLRRVGAVVREQTAGMKGRGGSLVEISACLSSVVSALRALQPDCHPFPEPAFALAAMIRQSEELQQDILHLAPWLGDAALVAALARRAWADNLRGAGPSPNDLTRVLRLNELAALNNRLSPHLGAMVDALRIDPAAAEVLRRTLAEASDLASARIAALEELVARSEELAQNDLEFLYDPARKLLTLGYNVETHRRDLGEYDLLASEARLCSFVGIGLGHLPLEHWFHLGRQLAPGGSPVLVSWSGSLFEYLMPLLIVPVFRGTLLYQTSEGAVRRQMRYGRAMGVPWGFSESCYNQIDSHQVYQYRAFGTPSLGLKRGLADDLVVAPYSSALALMISPRLAVRNLERMTALGFVGRFGLYEAVDYTPTRLQSGESLAIVRCYMAHHSGMSLLAMAQAITGPCMQRRFGSDPRFQSLWLLLQERIPSARARAMTASDGGGAADREELMEARMAGGRSFSTAQTPVPEVQLLSNGRYHVMVSNAGGGMSWWQDIALTRWREDTTRDNWGSFFYVTDVDSGEVWSTTFQPMCREPEAYKVAYTQGMAEFHLVQSQIQIDTQITVSPEDDVEVRRMTLTNLGSTVRVIDLTSYAEVVLMDRRAEIGHPAFHSLFLQSETIPAKGAILYTRRPRSAEERWPCFFHMMVAHVDSPKEESSVETDRTKFVGRTRTLRTAVGARTPGPLSGEAGFALDPIVAVRRRIRLMPRDAVIVDAVMGVARTREDAESLVDKYRDAHMSERVFDLSWTHSQVLLHQIRATEADAQLYSSLAGSLLYANPRHRANAALIARNRKGQSDLWSYGISGDLPIVLLRLNDPAGLDLARSLIRAHSYWRHKGLHVDLVIWTEGHAGYRQNLLDAILSLVQGSSDAKWLDRSGGVFVRNQEQVSEEDRMLFLAIARVVFSDLAGSFAEQVARRIGRETRVVRLRPVREPEPPAPEEQLVPVRERVFFNGLGGFTPDGREYVMTLSPGAVTPAPWANVIANPILGTVITETGGAYTWYENAHEFRLTPWNNDPTSDTSGEAFYVRDEETGRFWSPTPKPARGTTPYVVRHGLGYSAFEHVQDGIATEMTVFVGEAAPVKFALIKLKNRSGRARRLSVTGYAELVLGENRTRQAMHIITRLDPQTGALFAWNPFNNDFAGRVAFFQCAQPDRTVTGDRMEFLGRNGSLAAPAALRRERLSDRVGAGLDPCAAIQAGIEIPPGEERQLVFLLGAARNESEAHSLLRDLSGVDGAQQAYEAACDSWKRVLGGVYVETPDPSVNYLVNHWLLYQTLGCRFWGRSGYYQSSGAYGFRDQLQDSLAFLHECPWLTRQHLLTCAGRQFREGDVQHWWHMPRGRGARTRSADDYLWLPYVLCRYVKATADKGVLDEQVPFLEGRPLGPGEESYYDMPNVSDRKGTLYEHCALAVRRALQFGAHGLPLIRGGDWNDGMNRVGRDDKGESVWLAFFLCDVLKNFAGIAEGRNDQNLARQCKAAAGELQGNIDEHAWDGNWYLRAFFDDGTPLGSSRNPECRIDSLPQSWAVLSGAGSSDRAARALESVAGQLADRRLGLIRLLDPPFASAAWDPGYIKGYIPGVRENGGQYTHAAVWVAMAFAELRQSERAWELFQLINPIRHTERATGVATYQVEPYAVAADVYTAAGHAGRGGWTWYTGAAGWMYQLLVDKLLGLTLEVDTLTLTPLFPADWPEYMVHYRYRETFYHIRVRKTGAETWNLRRMIVDGVAQADPKLHLVDDRVEHSVEVDAG